MKKLLVAALAVLLAAAAGAYVIVVRPLVAPAAQTIAAEAALATPDLVLLAALNVRQMVFLERWLLGAPVIRAVDARAPRALDERSLLDHLAAARVDLRRDVEHVLYGLYPATERGARHAIVIVGRFDPGDIERYLVAELGGIARPVGAVTSIMAGDGCIWGHDDHWLFCPDGTGKAVMAVDASGGTPYVVTGSAADEPITSITLST